MSAEVTQLRPKRPCPICGKTSTQAFHPFCSRRCADVDLHRWLGGTYAIPVQDAVADDEEGDGRSSS